MSRRAGGIGTRIFVVGVPRSGTTLVQSLLAAHSEVGSFTESHLFSRHFKTLSASLAVLIRNPLPRLREFLIENDVAPDESAAIEHSVRRLLWPRLLLPLRTRAVASRLLGVLDEMAVMQRASKWVEKTPRHLRYIGFLERLFERDQSPRFVHVIRDGLETVASLYTASKSWEYAYDVETCVRRWNEDVALSASRISMPGNHFVLYDELTSQPEATLKRLLAELDLGWEPDILEHFAKRSERLITPAETWKASTSKEVRPSGTSSRALTSAQRHRVRESLRQDLYAKVSGATR